MPRYGRTGRRSVNPAGNGLVIVLALAVFAWLFYIGNQNAHSNDPDRIAARQPATLAELQVINRGTATVKFDASYRLVVTYHVDTTNNSDEDYTITLCSDYSYTGIASGRKEKFKPCFEYDISAHSTEKFDREKPESSTREPKEKLTSTGKTRITFVNEHQIKSAE